MGGMGIAPHAATMPHSASVLRPRAAFAICAAILSLASAPAEGATSLKLDRALREHAAAPGGTVRVIVRTSPGARGGVKATLRARGGRVRADHPSISAFTAEIGSSDLMTL